MRCVQCAKVLEVGKQAHQLAEDMFCVDCVRHITLTAEEAGRLKAEGAHIVKSEPTKIEETHEN